MSAAVWTTRDGRKILIRKMENRHLFNTIEMLRRQAPLLHAQVSSSFFGAELVLHGEAALDAIEYEQHAFENMTVEEFMLARWPKYAALVEEAWRRGLELLEFDNDHALRISTALVCRALVGKTEEVA